MPKPGGKRDFNNLRPISVLPALAKVLESVVAGQLIDYLDSNKLLSDAQSGFRSKHCTQDVLLKCTDDWKTALDKGKVVGTVMIDLSEALTLFATLSSSGSWKPLEYVTLLLSGSLAI